MAARDALRGVLVAKLGEADASLFTDAELDKLISERFTSWQLLTKATRADWQAMGLPLGLFAAIQAAGAASAGPSTAGGAGAGTSSTAGAADAGTSTSGQGGAGPSTSGGAGAAGPYTSGSVAALDVVATTYPGHLSISSNSSSTTTRAYSGKGQLVIDEWRWDVAGIKAYLRQELANVTLTFDPRFQGPLGHMTSEASCNTSFYSLFGRPAAVVAGAKLGKAIDVDMGAGNPTIGYADFCFTLQAEHTSNNIVLCVGEGKTPAAMLARDTVFPEARTPRTRMRKICEQICDYMYTRRARYGLLTSGTRTTCIRRVGDDKFEFTTMGLRPDSLHPTVLEAVVYMLLKAMAKGSWRLEEVAAPAVQPVAVPAAANEGEFRRSKRLRRSPGTADAAGTSGLSMQQGEQPGAATDKLRGYKLHGAGAVDTTDEVLGGGRCGMVFTGRYYGRPAAIKCIDADKQRDLLPELAHEAAVYEHMKALQGETIPELYGWGLCNLGNMGFLALSQLHGRHVGPDTSGAEAAVLRALQRIHDCGVLHGDIREQNVLVAEQSSGWKAWLLDFGLSSFSSDRRQQEEEKWQLRRMFRLSEHSDVTGEMME